EEVQTEPEALEEAPPPEAEAGQPDAAGAGGDTRFGDIDLGQAGATVEEATAFFEGLDTEQQEMVRAGCIEVLGAAEPAQDPMDTASIVCANLLTGGLIDPADIDEGAADAPAQ